MIIHSNLFSENKVYDTTKDLKDINRILGEVLASYRNTIFSTGTLIKERSVVKFKDGSWLGKGKTITFERQRLEILDKLMSLGDIDIKENIISIPNHNGDVKKYRVSDSDGFEKAMNILEFIGIIEICNVYKVSGVSTDKKNWETKRFEDKYFFEGEERELIEWAAENKIWHWLREVDNK